MIQYGFIYHHFNLFAEFLISSLASILISYLRNFWLVISTFKMLSIVNPSYVVEQSIAIFYHKDRRVLFLFHSWLVKVDKQKITQSSKLVTTSFHVFSGVVGAMRV